MANHNQTVTYNLEPFVWPLTLILSLLIGFIVLRPFLGITVVGLLVAFVFYPLYTKLMKKFSSGVSAALTTLLSLLIIGLPLIVILLITVSQAVNLASDLANSDVFLGGENLVAGVDDAAAEVNQRVESIFGIKEAVAAEDVDSFLRNTLPQVARGLSNLVLGIASGIPNFFTMFIVYLFVFTAGLTHGKQLRRTIEDLSPFDKKTNKLYVDRLGAMAKAMLKGQFLIAVLQGVVSAAVLAAVGFSSYFWVMAVVFTFMSFIPLGAGIITIPIGLVLLIFGNFWGAAAVLLNHFLVVTNIDNIIRPKVVPKDAQLPAVLTILGAFGGVALFGLVGVVYGPMLMIFITTTIESYIQHKNNLQT